MTLTFTLELAQKYIDDKSCRRQDTENPLIEHGDIIKTAFDADNGTLEL